MLESLIAILIVALGVLGVVGLYAKSVKNVDDAKYRGEASLLVNTLIGQMWVSDTHFASLHPKFDSTMGGAEYTEFAALVAQRMPNAAGPPVVLVTPGTTTSSSDVLVTITWTHPGDVGDPDLLALDPTRKFLVNATIGGNTP